MNAIEAAIAIVAASEGRGEMPHGVKVLVARAYLDLLASIGNEEENP